LNGEGSQSTNITDDVIAKPRFAL